MSEGPSGSQWDRPIPPPTPKPGTYRYAGFWIRFLACVIDGMIYFVMALVAAIVVFVVFVLGSGMDADDLDPQFNMIIQYIPAVMVLIVGAFYYCYFPSRTWQATPGKRICGIYIIRADGGPMTGALALGRCLAYFISSLPLCLGFVMAAWTDQHKALHDMICGTRVVYGKL